MRSDQVNWFCFRLRGKPLPPRQWLVENWIPLGQPSLFVMVEQEKVSALQLMIAVASTAINGLGFKQARGTMCTSQQKMMWTSYIGGVTPWTSEINYSDLKSIQR